MLKYILLISLLAAFGCRKDTRDERAEKPNIIYILADDLGYGDLSCYGQKQFQTPNIDKLAANGMLFTQHYAGSAVCAPSRSVLMTGLHAGHTYVRSNVEYKKGEEGQYPLADEAYTIPEMLQSAGYKTGAFGKWGLGMWDTEGNANKQGIDYFYGYACQRQAHRYYPTHLWENGKKVILEGNDTKQLAQYAPDLIHEKTLDFIRANRSKPFFAYVASVIPHAELLVPKDSIWDQFDGKYPETPWGFDNTSGSPYNGNAYGAPDYDFGGYNPAEQPHASFAAMVTRLDVQVGEIVELLKELDIYDNTLVIFTSDNGPHEAGGGDPDFFKGFGTVRGYKRDLYEGGIRVPMIATWPNTIKKGVRSDYVSAFYDVMPTFAELAGVSAPEGIDGLSFAPVFFGNDPKEKHDYFYWEFPSQGGKQAVRMGDWKAVRLGLMADANAPIELYDLESDPQETQRSSRSVS
ncbi:arylsulfatase [Reichenbachiella carrageenanivorans]|uniref:Arylsulfatase n=1 Tax=Reichenbachiella carrageenanivorans TaxID=2979869 RepID=A0ABY6D5U4_9BACT|nr:arylsulfatase [Reichenbachiella carrageenanivorans]UXX80970.1 arylsulfatase [Reichenbachiella carrageenanivorans]